MAVVGVTMVYFALTMLVGVLVVLARLVGGGNDRRARPTTAPAPPATRSQSPAATAAGDEKRPLELVALAAYGLHLRRRVAVRGSVPASPWSRAGRAQQVLRFPGRS